MTKSNKFLITGAAVAGLLAGTSASIKAAHMIAVGEVGPSPSGAGSGLAGTGAIGTIRMVLLR